jgi:prepilin peptidase CpaA
MNWIAIAPALILLVWIAVHDIRHYRISNVSVALLAAFFLLHVAVNGRGDLLPSHFLLAGFLLAVMILPFQFGWMGGGDVKVLAVAFLWTGLHCALFFALVLFAATTIHAVLAWCGALTSRESGARRKIPFGPAAALALGVTMLVCIAPQSA